MREIEKKSESEGHSRTLYSRGGGLGVTSFLLALLYTINGLEALRQSERKVHTLFQRAKAMSPKNTQPCCHMSFVFLVIYLFKKGFMHAK